MKHIILSGFLSTLFCLWAPAESSVWKVQKDGSVMYLGGTCHLLRPSDFPLPAEFDAAYSRADRLVFETDIAELQSPATQQKLMVKAMYSDGSTLKDHLSPETYALLAEYCAKSGLPVESLKSFKPSIAAVTLSMMELMKMGITTEGVDTHFARRAAADQKPVEFFETIDEQIQYVVEMSDGNEDAFIRHTIEEINELNQMFTDLIAAWKSGDAEQLNTLMNQSLRNFPDLYQKLLIDRNRNWMPRIEALLKTPEKEFILVGAAHLVGPDGILETLKSRGFSVEQVQKAPH